MTGHTILVVDADQETEEIIIATLETEGYLVFAASGREISSGLAGKISPHLIFLKPTANSVEGFETCKTIHNSELFKTVPIIMLASLRGPLDARYTTYYGIVDYLKMPLSSEELIEKTREILGSASPDLEEQEREETALLTEDMTEKGASVRCEESSDEPEYAEEEIGQTNEEYSYSDERENESRSLRARRGRRRRAQKSGPLSPAFIAMVAIAVLAGAFLSYKFFLSPTAVPEPVTAKPPRAVRQQAVLSPTEQQPVKTAEVEPSEPAKGLQEAPPSPSVAGAKAAAEEFYSVQVGAFKEQGSAESLAKTYKGKGYKAFTAEGTTKDKGRIYRVLIGKFENRKEALQLAGQIHTKERVSTTIFAGETK